MLKLGQPKRFRKGNLAMVSPRTTPGLPDVLTIWPESGDLRATGSLHKNDLVLIINISNVDQHIQYSKIFCARRNTVGWVDSKYLIKIQKFV
jgi:hypothetical protein